MSIPPPQAPTLGDRPGGTKTMRRPLVSLPTGAKAGLSCALLACTMGLALPAASMPQGIDLLASTPALAKSSSTSTYSKSYVKDNMFTLSAREYAVRINDMFEELGQPDYAVNLTKNPDGKSLDMDIRYKSRLVGFAEFCLADVNNSWIGYCERGSSKAFNKVLAIWFEDDDSAEYCFFTSLAMMMAADPSLSKYNATMLMSSLVSDLDLFDEDGKEYAISGQRQGDIWYCLIINSDGSATLAVDCS